MIIEQLRLSAVAIVTGKVKVAYKGAAGAVVRQMTIDTYYEH